MTIHDIYVLSPELSLAFTALLVIGLDLLVSRKIVLTLTAIIGLGISIGFTLLLWGSVVEDPSGSLSGVYNTLVVDRFSLFFKMLIISITFLVVVISADYVDWLKKLRGEYLGLIIISATGMMVLSSTTELISIYISLELTTLPLIALVAFQMTSRSSEAGMKFLILSATSSAFLLYGMVLIYGLSGSTHLEVIGEVLSKGFSGTVPFGGYGVLLGVILIIAGFGFKISSAPFHMWVPDVYEGAPVQVLAFLSTASKAATFAVLLRVFYIAFPSFDMDWAVLFAILAAVTMTLGNVMAMVQTNVKRLLAYSSIAHAGYMMVGLAAISSNATVDDGIVGPTSLLFYLAAYAATNLVVVFVILITSNKVGHANIDGFSGLGRRSRFLGLSMTLGLISLIGIPPTGLFIGKILLFAAAVNSDLIWLAVIGGINSVISAYYYLRIVRLMYMEDSPTEEGIRCSIAVRVALGISTSGVLIFGIAPWLLLRLTDVAASSIIP